MMTVKTRIPEAERLRRLHAAKISHAAENVRIAQAALKLTIEDARDMGLTWTMIGQAIGMTKQGVRQRWG